MPVLHAGIIQGLGIPVETVYKDCKVYTRAIKNILCGNELLLNYRDSERKLADKGI